MRINTPTCASALWSASTNAEWGQIVIAVIVAADGATPDPEQLRDYAAAAWAVRVHPTRWCFVTNCPPPRPAR